MKKRIRYHYFEEGNKFRSEAIFCHDDLYIIEIEHVNLVFTYKLYNSEGRIVYADTANTLAQAKIRAKKQLVNFGGIFYNEIRRKESI